MLEKLLSLYFLLLPYLNFNDKISLINVSHVFRNYIHKDIFNKRKLIAHNLPLSRTFYIAVFLDRPSEYSDKICEEIKYYGKYTFMDAFIKTFKYGNKYGIFLLTDSYLDNQPQHLFTTNSTSLLTFCLQFVKTQKMISVIKTLIDEYNFIISDTALNYIVKSDNVELFNWFYNRYRDLYFQIFIRENLCTFARKRMKSLRKVITAKLNKTDYIMPIEIYLCRILKLDLKSFKHITII